MSDWMNLNFIHRPAVGTQGKPVVVTSAFSRIRFALAELLHPLACLLMIHNAHSCTLCKTYFRDVMNICRFRVSHALTTMNELLLILDIHFALMMQQLLFPASILPSRSCCTHWCTHLRSAIHVHALFARLISEM